MTRMLSALVVALLLATTAAAVDYTAFEQITVANTAIGVTTATVVAGSGHPQANMATCRLETAEIRYRIDGTAPTTTVGTLLEIGDTLVLRGPDVLLRFSAIRTGGTSGVLDCTYNS
jgi:hypothetical protein